MNNAKKSELTKKKMRRTHLANGLLKMQADVAQRIADLVQLDEEIAQEQDN